MFPNLLVSTFTVINSFYSDMASCKDIHFTGSDDIFWTPTVHTIILWIINGLSTCLTNFFQALFCPFSFVQITCRMEQSSSQILIYERFANHFQLCLHGKLSWFEDEEGFNSDIFCFICTLQFSKEFSVGKYMIPRLGNRRSNILFSISFVMCHTFADFSLQNWKYCQTISILICSKISVRHNLYKRLSIWRLALLEMRYQQACIITHRQVSTCILVCQPPQTQ